MLCRKVTAEQKQSLEQEWNAFKAPPAPAGPKPFRFNASAGLATWNGNYTPELWGLFQSWIEAFVGTHKIWRYTATMEESLASPGRVHFHAFFEWRLKDTPDWCNGLDFMKFEGSTPNMQPNYLAVADGVDGVADKKSAPRGQHLRQSLDAGHFYCWMEKRGSLKATTNYPPFEPGGYCPTGRRLDQWLQQKKLDEPTFLKYTAEITRGFESRLRDVTAKRKFVATLRLDPYQPLHAPISPDKLPAGVVEWVTQIGARQDRFKALCLYGPSRTGKTALCRQFGVHIYFRNSLNWEKWEHNIEFVKYVVCDDIDWQDESKYSRDLKKALFSGQDSFDRCSADAFMRTLKHGKPLAVVMNDETAEEKARLESWKSDPWICANVIFVNVAHPLF